MPLAIRVVPSIGSTATSHSGPVPAPTSSPLKSIGALSFSPSPMTTVPCISTLAIITRIALTATPSASFLSPRPTQRPAAMAADSVTRTSSRARLRSGFGALMAHTLSAGTRRLVAAHGRRLGREPHLEPGRQVELVGGRRREVGQQVGGGVHQHAYGVAVRRQRRDG